MSALPTIIPVERSSYRVPRKRKCCATQVPQGLQFFLGLRFAMILFWDAVTLMMVVVLAQGTTTNKSIKDRNFTLLVCTTVVGIFSLVACVFGMHAAFNSRISMWKRHVVIGTILMIVHIALLMATFHPAIGVLYFFELRASVVFHCYTDVMKVQKLLEDEEMVRIITECLQAEEAQQQPRLEPITQ